MSRGFLGAWKCPESGWRRLKGSSSLFVGRLCIYINIYIYIYIYINLYIYIIYVCMSLYLDEMDGGLDACRSFSGIPPQEN